MLKKIRYLEDAIIQGYTEGRLPYKVGEYYESIKPGQYEIIRETYQRSLSMGRSHAIFRILDSPFQGAIEATKEGMSLWQPLQRKGADGEEYIYITVLNILLMAPTYSSYNITRLFKDKLSMALYYADTLIAIGSPEGYAFKGGAYLKIASDVRKAEEVWLEADARGLATRAIYREMLQYT